MNRRQLIASLLGLPAVVSVATVAVAPDDVIVIETDAPLNKDQTERITATARDVWPGRKVVVLGAGLHLRIARPTDVLRR